LKKPVRVQLSRKKGYRIPENTVVVSRPSKWGNPFKPGIDAPDVAGTVQLFIKYINTHKHFKQQVKEELKGKNLACWCKPGDSCHADVLLRIANAD
jgi:hypothetical protein